MTLSVVHRVGAGAAPRLRLPPWAARWFDRRRAAAIRPRATSGESLGALAAPAPIAASASPSRLVRTYAASLIEVVLQVEALRDGALRPRVEAVPLQALVAEVAQALEPLATEAGLRLFRDMSPAGAGLCTADPAHLRSVVKHLLLRALVAETSPGHVRIMITQGGSEMRITLLSRAPDAARPDRKTGGLSELGAVQRLLQPIGGALVLEPRRAGYLPLTVALRTAPSLAPALQAA